MNLIAIIAFLNIVNAQSATKTTLPFVSLSYEDASECSAKKKNYFEDDFQNYLNWIRAEPLPTSTPSPTPTPSASAIMKAWDKIVSFGKKCLNKTEAVISTIPKPKKYREPNLLKNFDLLCFAGAASHAPQAVIPKGNQKVATYVACNTKGELQRPCITPKFATAISESFGTLQSCFGLSTAETEGYLWKIAHESGFFPNVRSHTYVTGIGQLTGVAREDIVTAINNETGTFKEILKKLDQKISNPQPSESPMVNTCKKLKTVMNSQDLSKSDSCSLTKTPPQPMLDLMNGMIFSRIRCKGASEDVIPALKEIFKNDASANKEINEMKDSINILAYNAGKSAVAPVYKTFAGLCKNYKSTYKTLTECMDINMRNSKSSDARINEKAQYVVKIKDMKKAIQEKAPGKCGKL